MQTRFAASKLARYLHQTLAAVDHHLHCLAFVLLRIHRVLSLFCFHRVLFLSLSSRVRQIGGGSKSLTSCFVNSLLGERFKTMATSSLIRASITNRIGFRSLTILNASKLSSSGNASKISAISRNITESFLATASPRIAAKY